MRFGAYTCVIAVATLLALSVAHAQDEAVQKMVGTWKGKVELLDEPERTLVIKSVTRAGDIWIASIEYGPPGRS